jgi:hypothetical protein
MEIFDGAKNTVGDYPAAFFIASVQEKAEFISAKTCQ